jgi:pimeloyl-ACP methyl ester carboxylesterase
MNYRPLRAPHYSTLTLRGVAHRVTRWGDPQSPPVVLLHGWGDSGETFQFLVDSFATSRHWIAPDWRGFGGSDWTGPAYWFADYLADLDALLDIVSPEQPADLIGHSMGGNIASMYAGIRPERVSRTVNLEGIGLPRTRPEEAPARYRRWLDELREPMAFSVYESIEHFARLLRRRNPRLPEDRAHFIAELWLTPCEGGYTVRWDPAHKRVNPILYSREAAESCWAATTAPTLLVLGGQSDIRRALAADGEPSAFEGIYPQLQVQVLPQAGHMMHHEEPETLAPLIEDFLGVAL